MQRLVIYFISLFITFGAYSSTDNIAAIVNKTPITMKEFYDRKAFLKFVNNVLNNSPETEAKLKQIAINTLIDEQLFIQESRKLNINITDKDINKAIKNIEQDNNMPPGKFIENLRVNGINVDTLKQQIKAQLIKEKLAYGYFAQNINVNKNEVDEIASLSNKDFVLTLHKVTSIANNKASYAKLKSLKSKLKGCINDNLLLKSDQVKIEKLTLDANKLTEPLKSAIYKLKPGQTSIILEGEQPSFYILCSKEIKGMKDEEYDYITNVLANKKLTVQVQKYYASLKRRAYIKVLLK